MSWRLANSLDKLWQQVNAAYPNRNKASDGSIGDEAHQAVDSDHNPNPEGVVCALDLTHSPQTGFDAHALADRLRANRHPDLKYLISNKRMAGEWTGWQWVSYSGTSDPHINHIHISVGRGNDGFSTPPYDDTDDWAVNENSTKQGANDMITVTQEMMDLMTMLTTAAPNPADMGDFHNSWVGEQLDEKGVVKWLNAMLATPQRRDMVNQLNSKAKVASADAKLAALGEAIKQFVKE